MALTEQEQNFCREYVIDFVVIKAMERAGYAKKTADKNGYLMLRKPEIAACIAGLMKKHVDKQGLTAEAVLEEIRRIAFANIAAYYKWSDSKKRYVLKPLDELTPDQTAAIAEYRPGEFYKLYSKDAALDKLSKYFKLYSEIDATVTNFVLMPELKLNGKEVVFEVGKPAPKTPGQKKN